MGTLDSIPNELKATVSKIVDIDGKTRPQVKIALDEWLGRGWRLSQIYNEGSETRAIFIKDKE